MPCYCDIPAEADQAEIQRRCKEKMYFDAFNILTEENLKKSHELDIKINQLPLPDSNTALCNICKVLSEEQMKSIDAYYFQIKWDHKNLLDWYERHCIDDEKNSLAQDATSIKNG